VIKENTLVTVKSVRSVREFMGRWQWQKRFKFMRKQLESASLLSLYSRSGFQWFLSVWTVEDDLMTATSLNIICRPRACLCMSVIPVNFSATGVSKLLLWGEICVEFESSSKNKTTKIRIKLRPGICCMLLI
jgi:hypothetical protein